MSTVKTAADRLVKTLGNVKSSLEDIRTDIDAVILAQNEGGVLVMTLIQLLSEKGLLSSEDIEERFDFNKASVLNEEGECEVPLSTLLTEGVNSDGD